MSPGFGQVRSLLEEAVASKASPAAAIEVGDEAGVVWRDAVGTLTYDEGAPSATPDTIFDLASLTKVIVTATLAMRAIDAGRLNLDDRVASRLREWQSSDRSAVTIRDLLAHCSGLTAYLPLFRDCRGRTDFEHAISEMPLEYQPRARALYSDLGFILLGFILEDTAGATLAAQFTDVERLVEPEPLAFTPPHEWRGRIAPTEVDPWRGRLLVGDVQDENAWALGGVAGHAGLFGTAAAVGTFARLVLRTLGADTPLARRGTLREFVQRTAVSGSSRALAWDTMLPTSSCGRLMSSLAFGHTGFTGTSLWIDPDPGLYIVLLANRVHPTRGNERFKAYRPKVHDAVMQSCAR